MIRIKSNKIFKSKISAGMLAKISKTMMMHFKNAVGYVLVLIRLLKLSLVMKAKWRDQMACAFFTIFGYDKVILPKRGIPEFSPLPRCYVPDK